MRKKKKNEICFSFPRISNHLFSTRRGNLPGFPDVFAASKYMGSLTAINADSAPRKGATQKSESINCRKLQFYKNR